MLRCRAKARPGELAGTKRFVVVRGFVVTEGREADFERAFGLGGIWQDFLRRAEGYTGSRLRRELWGSHRRYKLFDYWRTHEDFEGYRRERQAEIERFSQLIANEGLVVRETLLGSYYREGPDESGLVLR